MATARAQELDEIYTKLLEMQEIAGDFLRELEGGAPSPDPLDMIHDLPALTTATVGEARVYVTAISEIVAFIEHRRLMEHHHNGRESLVARLVDAFYRY